MLVSNADGLIVEFITHIPTGFGWSIGHWHGQFIVSVWEILKVHKTISCPNPKCGHETKISKDVKYRRGCYCVGNSLEEVIEQAKIKLKKVKNEI